MANPSNGQQQISTFYGKDLRSLYANQELLGLIRPGSYNVEVTPEQGSTDAYIRFRIKAGSIFVFQDTAEEYPGEGYVPLVAKVYLHQDAVTPETTILSLPGSNIILYAYWVYDTSPANRYMTFLIEPYTGSTPNFVPDASTHKLNKIPVAVIKGINVNSNFSSNFGTGGTATVSYLEFWDQLDFVDELYSFKHPIKFVHIAPNTGPGIISLVSGQVIGPNGLMSVSFFDSTGTSRVTIIPKISEISTINISTSTYYDVSNLLNKDATPDTSVWSSLPVGDNGPYLNRANYGYTWLVIPDSPLGISTIDALVLVPYTQNDVHGSTYKEMTMRPKLRFYRTEVSSENLTLSSQQHARSLLKSEAFEKLSNKLIKFNNGFLLGFIIRGFSETKFSPKNILPVSQFIPQTGGIPPDRLLVPIIGE